MNDSPPAAEKQSRLSISLVVLFAVNILNFYDRHVPGALTEPIRNEFGLTDTQVGLLGTVFTWIYAVAGVPLGRLADSWSRKRLLACGIFLWTSLTAMAAVVRTFPQLLVTRLGVGVGEATVAPSAASYIGDLFPAARRARPLALFMLGVPVGGALGYFLSLPIAQAFGWRAAMALAALPAVLLIPAVLMLPEPRRGAGEVHREAGPRPSMWTLFRIPTLWWIMASGAFLNFNMYALGTFLSAFLVRIHGLSLTRTGIAIGIIYLVGGVGGGLVAGMVGDRVVHKRDDGRMLAAAIISSVGAPVAFWGILLPAGSLPAAVVLITIAYGVLNTYYGLVYSSIQDIVPASLRGAAMAIYFMVMYMCGASFGPLLTGALSDRMAWKAARAAGASTLNESFRAIGLQQAMLVIPALLLALAFVLYGGSRTIGRDIARRRAKTASATII